MAVTFMSLDVVVTLEIDMAANKQKILKPKNRHRYLIDRIFNTNW